MDIRKNPEALPTAKIFGIDENSPLMKVKESLIFNLVQKKNLELEMLNKLHEEPLINLQYKTLEFTKYYVHSYIVFPALFIGSSLLYYYQRLSHFSFVSLVCVIAGYNEFAKYRRIMNLDAEKSKAFKEYKSNFKFLLSDYASKISFIDAFKMVWDVDMYEVWQKVKERNEAKNFDRKLFEKLYFLRNF